MTREGDPPRAEKEEIGSIEELMAHAYAIEAEAEERYRELSNQMEAHNNLEVAALFRKLAEYEGEHAREIEARAADMSLPLLAPWEFKWSHAEAPELVDTLALHYLMSPQTVLSLALDAERQAFEFFSDVAARATEIGLSEIARIFAAEEEEHIQMIEEMIKRLGPTSGYSEEDLDNPLAQG
jgi:rubrerythrin